MVKLSRTEVLRMLNDDAPETWFMFTEGDDPRMLPFNIVNLAFMMSLLLGILMGGVTAALDEVNLDLQWRFRKPILDED